MYYRGKMFGFVHLYSGQEAVSTGESGAQQARWAHPAPAGLFVPFRAAGSLQCRGQFWKGDFALTTCTSAENLRCWLPVHSCTRASCNLAVPRQQQQHQLAASLQLPGSGAAARSVWTPHPAALPALAAERGCLRAACAQA